MQINHHFTQEVLIPATGEFEEVTVHVTCDCNEVRAQRDVGIMNDYLELEGVTIDSIYLDDKEITDREIFEVIAAFIRLDHDFIETAINEEN